MSDFVQPHRGLPTRLPRPWDSPGKNTGVGCHFLLQCRKVKSESEVAQSCPTLCNPMDCSLPGSSVHGIFQARVLEWGAIALLGMKQKQWQTLFSWAPKSLWTLMAAMKLKDTCSLEENNNKSRQHIKKQRYHFAIKGLYSQSYGFSSGHVQMWELDHKEGWAPKNWCFRIVVLEKILQNLALQDQTS